MADVLTSDALIDEPSDYGSLRPGSRLGRYELLVPIARGGMARVWAARLHGQRGFQKLVAIKTILPHMASDPEFERMFLDEARIASGVHHPNVCEIYELGEEQRTLYLVMEWVSGDSLARVLRVDGRPEAIDARVVARVVADACAGLHAAHELADDEGRLLGVVHRDLSPHNILLTADGTTKVADFGVAKALGQLHEVTSAGQLKGKLSYMAPEQVTGAEIDRRSDVFSLGCVLYEATTGQRPFRGEGEHQVMHAVLKGEFARPSTLVRHYPQELEHIVQRALSPQPILRYPTAERMRFALEELLAKGHLVTQANVAQVVRARIGEAIDRRKERIRQASSSGDRDSGWSEPPGPVTPAGHAPDPRSGVQATGEPWSSTSRPPPPMPSDRPPPQQMAPLSASPSSRPPPVSEPRPHSVRGHAPLSHAGLLHGNAPRAAGETRPPLPPAAPSEYAMAAFAGLLAAALIGGGGFVGWRLWRPALSADAPGAALLAEAPSAPREPAGGVATASAEITLHLSPEEAQLSIDGQEAPDGTRRLPRPAKGDTVVIVARAKDHEDVTILVDFFTSSPMEVALARAGSADAVPPVQPADELPPLAAAPVEPARDAAKDLPKKGAPKGEGPGKLSPKDVGLPANPY